jgi:hypothetical protein
MDHFTGLTPEQETTMEHPCGAPSRDFGSIRSTYVFGGSVMCESAEMIGLAVALPCHQLPSTAARRRRRSALLTNRLLIGT